MPALVLPEPTRRARWIPQSPVRANLDHPSVQGMVGLWAPQSQVSTVRNLIGKGDLAKIGTVSPRATVAGIGADYASGGHEITIGSTHPLAVTGPFTAIWAGVHNSTPVNNTTIIGTVYGDGTAAPYYSWVLRTPTGLLEMWVSNGVGGWNNPAVSWTYPIGSLTVYVVTLTAAGAVAVWANGTRVISSSGVGPVSYTTNNEFSSSTYASALENLNSTTLLMGLWPRVLGNAEIMAVSADPTALLDAPSSRRYFDLTGTGASGGAVTGTIAVTLANVTSSITAVETITGSIAVTLANVTSALSATETMTGTIAVTLGNVTPSISGTVATSPVGTIAAVLDNVQPSISGSVANPPTSSQLVLRSTANVITSAAQLIVPAHQYAYARVTNKTGVTIYVGGADVTTANGYPILNDGSEQFELRMTDALYAIAASGSNNLNVLVQIH